MKKGILAVVWLAFGTLNWGLLLGGFTHRFPYFVEIAPAIVGFVTGPLGTPAALLIPGPPYHILWKPYTKEQRWEAYQKKWPSLTREDFEGDE